MSQISIKTITCPTPPGRRMTEVKVGPISGSLGRILEAHFGISVGDFSRGFPWSWGIPNDGLPSGKQRNQTVCKLENGDLVRGFSHEKMVDLSTVMLVYQFTRAYKGKSQSNSWMMI
jgi:hypothetical protein